MGLRYDKAIQLPKEEEDASAIFYLSLLFISTISLLIWFPVNRYGNQLLDVLGASALKGHLWWIPANIFLFSLILPLQAWLTRLTEYGAQAKYRLLKQVTMSSSIIGGGLIGHGSALELTGLRFIGQLIAPLELIRHIWKSAPRLTSGTPGEWLKCFAVIGVSQPSLLETHCWNPFQGSSDIPAGIFLSGISGR